MWFAYERAKVRAMGWHGTLLTDKQDAVGTHYRRNRYYDPSTGRFTQEDPIGLAGGLNVYGFAEGDPVSYSDPYGLCSRSKCPLDFGQGYRGRVDSFMVEGELRHEIHVYRLNPAGEGIEIGVFGRDGWIARHRFNGSDPGVPRAVLAKINGENVTQLRQQGAIGPRGTQNIKGGSYSAPVAGLFRRLNTLGIALDVFNIAENRRQAESLGINYWTYARLRLVASHEEIEAEVMRMRGPMH